MSVTIFGILNIGFAVLGLFGLLFSLVILSHTDHSKNPMLQAMYDNPAYAAWIKISMPLGGVVSVALLAAGLWHVFEISRAAPPYAAAARA